MKKSLYNLKFQLLLSALYISFIDGSLSDITSRVFKSNGHGVIAAYGDYNADKATDVFVLGNNGLHVDILEADIDISRDGTKFNRKNLISASGTKKITSVVPGDFNGDAEGDVLVTRQTEDTTSTKVTVEIYRPDEYKDTPYLVLDETLRDQPIVVDSNGDMIPDLFGETEDKRYFWEFNKTGSYTLVPITNGSKALPPLKVPQSSGFLDLDGDLTADLCAVSVIDGRVTFEFWLNKNGNLEWNINIPAPPELKVVGQASFADLNGNHEINIILPGCLDDDCKESAVFVWSASKYSEAGSAGEWHKLRINFKHSDDRVTSFPKTTAPNSWLSLYPALRLGDFNLDGYPDALVVLKDSHPTNEKYNISAFLLYNEDCGSGCEGFSRTFSIDYRHSLNKAKPTLAAFFDLMENGVLDILVSEIEDDGETASMRAIEQDFTGDASFLKIVVVSGLCYDSCPDGNTPYGVNQAGPVAKFESTTPTGGDQIGVASQLSQSAYFSLQLPFVLFGLGQTPNFVDDLTVGIPYPKGSSPRHHSWNTIIPNSQVIVIPYPVDDPGSWKHELYVTPSRLVMLTGVSLLGTCAFIAIIIGLLHWRERREDKREKIQESQRFHFDAM